MNIIHFFGVCFLAFLFISCATVKEPAFELKRVAHAAGGIDGKRYTNGIAALDQNYDAGFRYFEVDFSFTTDDAVVCLHHWKPKPKYKGDIFSLRSTEPLSLEEFKIWRQEFPQYQICTLEELVLWFEAHPDAFLVTDVIQFERNLEFLESLSQEFSHLSDRVIPQIYQPENYKFVRNLGYQNIIWTLYNFEFEENDFLILEQVRQFTGPVVITMSEERARSTLPKELLKLGVPTYAHTVNLSEVVRRLKRDYGVSEVYTDFLSVGE